jgi:TatD DNase family protein
MAVVKGVSIEEMAQATTENFSRLFHVPMSRLAD